MGKKFNCDIISKSTFSNKSGTKICQSIETSEVKSIVKNEKLVTIEMKREQLIKKKDFYDIYQSLLKNNVIVEAFQKEDYELHFRIKKEEQNKVQELLESNYKAYQIRQEDFVKLSIIGYGIAQDNQVLSEIMKILRTNEIDVLKVNLTQSKIEILVREIENNIVAQLHQKLING